MMHSDLHLADAVPFSKPFGPCRKCVCKTSVKHSDGKSMLLCSTVVLHLVLVFFTVFFTVCAWKSAESDGMAAITALSTLFATALPLNWAVIGRTTVPRPGRAPWVPRAPLTESVGC